MSNYTCASCGKFIGRHTAANPCQTQAEWLANEVAIYQAEGWTDACVEWPFNSNNKKRGVVWFDSKLYLSHRVAWFLVKGEWPSQTIDHLAALCTSTLCFNVAHMQDVSHSLNVRRGLAVRWGNDVPDQ